ncbi:MAG: helix-turn-helix transcriptional regulator [Acaryochloridaceae cyanobacterium CSU_3_4]|nr:helix-turn-helix transcriptional regulator [Acaryochloridaceae cyanobacterium CSU_3_4]
MAITIEQQDYQALFEASEQNTSSHLADSFDVVSPYPEPLGQGCYRSIDLREGIELRIEDYQLHDDLVVQSPERSHPIEYTFYLVSASQPTSSVANQYFLCGSGTAPVEIWNTAADQQILEVNVHLEPIALQAFLGESFDLGSAGLDHLIRPAEQLYYQRQGTTTAAMQTTLHQLLHCPFVGITQKMYLETKVWELMALLIDQEQDLKIGLRSTTPLKTDDIERVHHAKDILLQHHSNPPSLMDLARRVGLNDCTLKRGFRQVFGTTAFGYLQDHRLEQARQLLQEQQLNVSEVARYVGFSSCSGLSRAFRKKYGVSPKQYMTL